MPQHNEASVEEILESIKKVIARDNREAAVDERRPHRDRPADVFCSDNPENHEEVLDLAEMHLAEFDGEENSEAPEAPLTSETVRESMRDNLAALAMLAEPGAPPQIVRSGETSLEGLVRDMLRPMLAEWLDKNLPGMVEKMVQAEIARIAGKGR